jgi:hypothetical protein
MEHAVAASRLSAPGGLSASVLGPDQGNQNWQQIDLAHLASRFAQERPCRSLATLACSDIKIIRAVADARMTTETCPLLHCNLNSSELNDEGTWVLNILQPDPNLDGMLRMSKLNALQRTTQFNQDCHQYGVHRASSSTRDRWHKNNCLYHTDLPHQRLDWVLRVNGHYIEGQFPLYS